MGWVAGAIPLHIRVTQDHFSSPTTDTRLEVQMRWADSTGSAANGGKADVMISAGGAAQRAAWNCTPTSTTSDGKAASCTQVFRALVQLATADYFIPDGLVTLRLAAQASSHDGINSRQLKAHIWSLVVINNAIADKCVFFCFFCCVFFRWQDHNSHTLFPLPPTKKTHQQHHVAGAARVRRLCARDGRLPLERALRHVLAGQGAVPGGVAGAGERHGRAARRRGVADGRDQRDARRRRLGAGRRARRRGGGRCVCFVW